MTVGEALIITVFIPVFFGLLASALLALIPGTIAKNKGYNAGLWWLYGFFLFWIALIHALCLKDLTVKPTVRVVRIARPQYAQPQYTQPQYAQPQYAQPQYAQPQYAQPQYAQPQYAQPQYAQPQYAQPQYAQPEKELADTPHTPTETAADELVR